MTLIKELEFKNQSLYKRLWELEEENERLKKKTRIPLVAKVFPELIANDLVGVQPMFSPIGLEYALRYRYSS